MTFDQELHIWDASRSGLRLRCMEKLPVDHNDRPCLVTVRRGEEMRKVYVDRELGRTMHGRFVKALETEYIDSVARGARREANEK